MVKHLLPLLCVVALSGCDRMEKFTKKETVKTQSDDMPMTDAPSADQSADESESSDGDQAAS
jgi:hypothetical protein